MMEQTEADTSEAQPETSSSEEEEEEEEEDEGFVGLTTDQSDQGQGPAGEDEEEDGDEDDEDDEEGAAAPEDAPTTNPFSRILSIWGTTKYIGKWKTAHRRGYHIDRLTDSPTRKALLTQHELDCKTGVSLPMVSMIEAEALQILQDVERGYKRKLGASHPLTKEVQRSIVKLSSRVAAKTGGRRRRLEGWRGTLWRWGVALAAMLGLSGGAGHALPSGERPTGAREPQ